VVEIPRRFVIQENHFRYFEANSGYVWYCFPGLGFVSMPAAPGLGRAAIFSFEPNLLTGCTAGGRARWPCHLQQE
ncbi:MAG: hypothetical protein KAU38_01695, partial [Desulfobacterales bacterium]|nr:hypothetical protein [Desulfobacterales bacterium]